MQLPLACRSALLVFALGAGGVVAQSDPHRDGVAAIQAKQYEKAIRLLEHAHSLKPSRVDTQRQLAVALSHRGSQLHNARMFEESLHCFQRADRMWPGQLNLVMSVGVLHLELKQLVDAKRRFEAVLELEPGNARALGNLARIAAEQDDVVKAAELYERARKRDSSGRYEQHAQKYARHAEVESEFKSLRHGMFEIQYPTGREYGVEKALPVIRSWLNQALRDLRRDLGRMPQKPVKIVLYAKGQYQHVSSAKHWAKAYFDGKVRLDLGDWEQKRDTLKDNLRHELAHAFLESFYPNLPSWLHEGYAQLVEGRSLDVARTLFRRGRLSALDIETFVDKFADSNDERIVGAGYAQSLLVVAHLRDARTPREFARLLGKISKGMESGKAVREVYRLDFSTVFQAAVPSR